MSLIKEFKTFVLRGNVMDLAVGVILGGAFGDIVKSLVSDVIMPPIGLLTGGVDFKDLYINLDSHKLLNGKAVTSLAEAKEAGVAVIAYGAFLNMIISFLIIAGSIFLMLKVVNLLQKELARLAHEEAEAQAQAEPSAQEKLLAEIRDLLKEQAKARGN